MNTHPHAAAQPPGGESGPPPQLEELDREAMRALLRDRFGEPAYRGDQLFAWIHHHGVSDFDAMSNLPKRLRARLREQTRLGCAEVLSAARARDGTRKILLALADRRRIEAVMIPDERRLTLCVSTQVGCALGCSFCATGKLGFVRNLRPGEIVAQVHIANRLARADAASHGAGAARGRITHLVLMGMGEPLLNDRNTAKALEILFDPHGVGLAPKRVTLSTVGVGTRLWPFLERTGVRLAVSLHAADPNLRRTLMPIERAHPLAALLVEIRKRQGSGALKQRVTFEYVLLAGVNDAPAHAAALARAVHGIRCKINLIAFNPYPGSPYERPTDAAVDRFRATLRAHGLDVYVRRARGREIAAACGQLALRANETSPVVSLRPSRRA